jgi:hypothetical protein
MLAKLQQVLRSVAPLLLDHLQPFHVTHAATQLLLLQQCMSCKTTGMRLTPLLLQTVTAATYRTRMLTNNAIAFSHLFFLIISSRSSAAAAAPSHCSNSSPSYHVLHALQHMTGLDWRPFCCSALLLPTAHACGRDHTDALAAIKLPTATRTSSFDHLQPLYVLL